MSLESTEANMTTERDRELGAKPEGVSQTYQYVPTTISKNGALKDKLRSQHLRNIKTMEGKIVNGYKILTVDIDESTIYPTVSIIGEYQEEWMGQRLAKGEARRG